MRKEKDKNPIEERIKWGKLISFIIAIILLIIAISASMAQEKKISNINYEKLSNQNKINNNSAEASTDLNKNINEVKEQNNIGGDNEEEKDSEIEDIKNDLNEMNVKDVNINETTEVNTDEQKQIENNTEIDSNKNRTDENNDESENTLTNTNEELVEFAYPVEGEIIKEFAKDSLVYSETLEEWITHLGIDIKANRTTIVKATADGTVKSIKNDPRYGLTITIEHKDGYTSVYSSLLSAEFVKEGETVTQGQTIGTVGNSAVFESGEDNHLHFELLKDGSNINPEMYLK